ncbi:MAG: HEAT repeat domain-containing protein [Waterburya sp.]
MSQIKSEALNQSATNVHTILNLALAAAQQQNWLEVYHCLQLLPQTKTNQNQAQLLLSGADWQLALDLALAMLFKGDFQHKWEITKLLPLFGQKMIPTLTHLLKNETIEVDIRWFICQVLGQFKTQTVVLTLVELLQQTTDQELIAIAGKTLTQIGNSAIKALIELLAQPEYRLLAVQSLSYIRTIETIEPLLNIAQDKQPELRVIAIKALGSFHDSRIPPVLIQALQDTVSNVRKEAAIALGFRSDICDELNLVSNLQPLLHDLNLEVCRQAAISLGRMQHQEATNVLFKVLQTTTTPTVLKLDLVKALGWSELSSAIDYLQQALINSEELVTQEIITVLGRINSPQLKSQAAQVLVNFWQQHKHQSNSPEIMQALATSLGELRCNFVQATLESLTIVEDRKVQLHALAALKKLT